MQLFLEEKIEYYKNEMISALDRNDSTEAIKSRAILKELECIRDYLLHHNADIYISERANISEDLSSKEVAEILGINLSTVTRNSQKLGAYKYKGNLRYPKEKVYEEQKRSSNIKKRGRKPLMQNNAIK